MSKSKAFFREAVQFVPVITLASSFIAGGGVDLNRAATLFVISGIGAAVITAVLAAKQIPLNPILLGTNLWLVVGALGFGIPIPPLAELLGRVQAFGLYTCVFALGTLLVAFSPTGYIGMVHPEPKRVRQLSLILLALTAVALGWSYFFIENIRLGGALPFIVLNVTRRMMMRRNKVKAPAAL